MIWNQVTLGDALQANDAPIMLEEHEYYKQAGVQPYPRGVVLRALKSGLDFPRKQQKRIRTGQFIISKWRVSRKVWGIVPPELDNAVITKNHYIFDLHRDLHPDYFAAYLSTALFRQASFAACSQTGRLNSRQFAGITLPLPTAEDQVRIAELWREISMALQHTAEMLDSLKAVKHGVAADLFRGTHSSWERRTLGDCVAVGQGRSGQYALSVTPPDQVVLGDVKPKSNGIGLMPGLELDSQYLYYYLESQRQVLATAFYGIKSGLEDILRGFPLPLPNLYEQRKIASLIEQHDQALFHMRTEQIALRKLTQGIMHLIFSGQLNLQDALPLLRNR